MIAEPRETDYDIELLDGGVRAIFRPTASEFTYRQLADLRDIAREGPLSRSPNARHAQTGETGCYDEREIEA
jgi:hypothetical protein